MPKRKSDQSYDDIRRKIRKLEKELRHRSRSRSRRPRRKRRHRRHRSYSSTGTGSDVSSRSRSRDYRRSLSMDQQDEVVGYIDLDENDDFTEDNPLPEIEPRPGTSQNSPVFVPSVVVVPPKDIHSEPPPAAPESPTNMVDASSGAGAPPPAASAPAGTAPPSATQPPDTDEQLPLDNDLLNILGSDPTTDKKYGKDIHKDLPIRFQHWATTGLSKDMRKDLKENYLTPENCKLIDPPELNAEIKAAVSDIVAKRDKAIAGKQKQLTSAITCLGQAITHVLSSKEKDTQLLKLLMDSVRLICDCQHADTLTRRNFLLNTLKKEMREQLQNTKVDKLLFGENLAETLKCAKAINKSGIDLKPAAPKVENKKQITPSPSNTTKNLNWRNPGQVRRQTGPPRMKEPAMTSTRSRQPASSKLSQHPQRTSQRRH
ncbi:hypothetical protein NE865_15494 [Phthorimaea operculella]|nr:hypothetical protein NE865_15494 [Phthorimaea operculella]